MQRETIEGLNITNIISDAIRVDDGQHCRSMARADGVWDALNRAGYEIVRKPEPAPAVFMVSRVTHEDGSVTERRSAPVETEDAPGYAKAVRLLRGRLPSVVELADALGGASPDGPEGNVWKLRDRIDRGPPSGGFWAAPEGLRANETVALEPRAASVRKLVEAHRLIADAADILGHDAVDEILNNLADPVRGEAA